MQNLNLATILDVAKIANVSFKEVMAVLNGHKLDPTLHQRILETIERLGSLHVNHAPGGQTIGVVVPGIVVEDYIGAVISGINNAAQQAGYNMTLHTRYMDDAPALVENYFHTLFASSHRTDALIVGVPYEYNATIARVCQAYGCPCILLDGAPDHFATIGLDNRHSMHMLIDHLIELGHQRIGFVTGFMYMSSAIDRLAGYRDALTAAGLPIDEDLIIEGGWTIESGAAQVQELLPLKPTAIAFSNDLMAMGAIGYLKSMGWTIPNDISITGFDDIPMAATISPRLTTVRQPMEAMGATAAEMAIGLIRGETLPDMHPRFAGKLIQRQSTSTP